MSKHKISLNDIFLIIANLVPLYGVWTLGWDAREVFIVFCLESIIVGLLTITKMAITGIAKKSESRESNNSGKKQGALSFILFFIIHYGFFVTIQMIAFFDASDSDKVYNTSVLHFFTHLPDYLSREAWMMLGLFIIGYCYKSLFEFILNGMYRSASLPILMFIPYGRIAVQQFTVIMGGIFLSFGAGRLFMLVFVAVKIFILVYVRFDEQINRLAAIQKHRQGV